MTSFPLLELSREKAILSLAEGETHSCTTETWLAFGGVGVFSGGYGWREEQFKEKVERAAGDLSENSFGPVFRPGENARWDREARRTAPGGAAFWLSRSPKELRDSAFTFNPFARATWNARWQKEFLSDLLAEHRPKGLSALRPKLHLRFVSDFTAKERRQARAAAVFAWQGAVSAPDDKFLDLLLQRAYLAFPLLFLLLALGAPGLLLVSSPNDNNFNFWLDWTWPGGALLGLLFAWSGYRAAAHNLGLLIGPWAALSLAFMGICAASTLPLSFNAVFAGDDISVLAGVVEEGCASDTAQGTCQISARIMGKRGSLGTVPIKVSTRQAKELPEGALIFRCYRKGALGHPFVWRWDDRWPDECQKAYAVWLGLSPQAVREHLEGARSGERQ